MVKSIFDDTEQTPVQNTGVSSIFEDNSGLGHSIGGDDDPFIKANKTKTLTGGISFDAPRFLGNTAKALWDTITLPITAGIDNMKFFYSPREKQYQMIQDQNKAVGDLFGITPAQGNKWGNINFNKLGDTLLYNVAPSLIGGSIIGAGLPKLAKIKSVESPKSIFDDTKDLISNPQKYVADIKENPVTQTVIPEGNTQLNTGLEFYQPNYFNHQSITINPGSSIDENAQNIRNIHSSNINSTVNEAAYLQDDIDKMLTPEENEAVGLSRDFHRDSERIQTAIDSGYFNNQIPSLRLALNPTENMIKADNKIEHAYNQAANVLQEKGLIKGKKDNYINRLYEDRPVDNSVPLSLESYLQDLRKIEN